MTIDGNFDEQVPLIIPLVVLVVSVYLIIGPIVDKPTIEYLYAAMFILGGMIFYVPFVHYKVRIPFMGKLFYCHSLALNSCFQASVITSFMR